MLLAISVKNVFKHACVFYQILNILHYQKKKKKKREAYPGAQTQPLMHGDDGAHVKFIARFAHVVSQFTPPAGSSGSGNLQSKYCFPSGQT